MNQDKFGKLIKEIRKKNNLTQKDLADKYNVTYQAVSKWETGKNMPDISLIKQISKDYNIKLDELLDGNIKKNNKILLYIILGLIIIILIFFGIKMNNRNNNFEFKTISTTCNNFNISGSISYNSSKSAIYISNVKYCGGDDTDIYNKIECTLYENDNGKNKIISSCNNDNDKKITLEEFLKDVNFSIDNYNNSCKEYSQNSLYLEIKAAKNDEKTVSYKIPLSLNDSCNK